MTESYRKMMPAGIATFVSFIVIIAVVILQGCSDPSLKPWHTEKLTEEFAVDKADEVKTFADYLALEDRLFRTTGPKNLRTK